MKPCDVGHVFCTGSYAKFASLVALGLASGCGGSSNPGNSDVVDAAMRDAGDAPCSSQGREGLDPGTVYSTSVPLMPPGPSHGYGTAVSADGNTVLVGDQLNAGAVVIFSRGASGWSESARIVAPSGLVYFGNPVALSRNGRVAVVGSSTTQTVYWQNDQGSWTLANNLVQGAVALTTDGGTIVVAATTGVTVYARTQDRWNTAPGPSAGVGGKTIALSGDGNTLAVGFPDRPPGGVAVFTRRGTGWSEIQSLPLPRRVGDFGGSSSDFGSSVALSFDGQTMAVGDRDGDFDSVGAAFEYTLTCGRWNESTRIARPQSRTSFGGYVGLSDDANTLVVSESQSDHAAEVDVFVRVGRVWRLATTLPGNGILAADGATIVTGGYFINGATGAVVAHSR